MKKADKAADAAAVGTRNWLVMVLLGLSGQIAWNVENSWFNTFVFDEITPDPGPIAVMVAVSAIVATLTTLLMGAFSDRVGKRKPFIFFGYILWALSTIAYPMSGWANSVSLAVFLVIALDGVMTFFGSTANDAAFNAWVTDITVPGNRGIVEGVLNFLPVLAVMIGMGVSGILIDSFGYTPFFLTLGGLVLIMGLAGSILLREGPQLKPVPKADRAGFIKAFSRIFSPSEIVANRELYLVFITMAVYGIGYQVTAPYEIIFLNAHLGISKSLTGIITAMVAPVLIIFALPIGKLTDRGKGFQVAFAGYIVAAIGQALFSTTSNVVLLTIFAVLKSVGFLMFIVLGAWNRDLMPKDARGVYQGVRLVFFVLLPMIIGPAIGSGLIRAFGVPTVLNGEAGFIPPPAIYWVSSVFMLASLLPVCTLYILRKKQKAGG